MNRSVIALLSCVLLVSGLVACGGDDVAPPPNIDAGDTDAGSTDAGPRDAGSLDAGHLDAGGCTDDDGDGRGAMPCGDDCDDTDGTRYPGATEVCDGDDEDCNDTTYGADADADGYESSACCNGTDNCGADCDDALNTVNPGAAEVCNGGIDDDCNGVADLADGVCVPCAAGYTGFDGSCTNIDECAIATTCGGSRTGCMDNAGSYVCTCATGYAAPATGGVCADVDECAAAGTDDCDRDPAATCMNEIGSFTCACPAGFVPSATAGHGAGGCLLPDPSLSSLVPSTSALSPAFAGGTTAYTLALPPGATSIVFTPSVAYPTRATITVDGVTVVSGAASAPISLLGLGARPVLVTVTTESGATRTYTVVVARSPAYLKASNTGASDSFGFSASLSADGTRLAVGAYQEDSSATGIGGNQADNTAADSGAVYVFARVGTTWAQEAYLKASNTGAGDYFGWSVSLSADGARLAVGAYQEASSATGIGGNQADNSALQGGAVYVFSRTLTTWTQEAYVKASNTGVGDEFGYSVSLAPDGTRLAVGALYEASSATGIGGNQADNSVMLGGAVYVFSRTGTSWAQEAYVKASNTGPRDNFGSSVSLSVDGSRLAVGAQGESSSATGVGGDQANNSAMVSGAVYVFSRTATTWTQEAYVKASNTGATDHFGTAVSLSSDGTRLAVGAYGEASSATGVGGSQADNSAMFSGAVYVFSRTATTWTQEAYVKASNTAAGDLFGYSVSLSPDGTRLAVGAHGEASSATGVGGNQADNSMANSGAVYVLSRTGTTWTQEAYVKASNTGAGDYFGRSVSLSSDGTRLATGASGEASNATGVGGNQADNSAANSGAVYVY